MNEFMTNLVEQTMAVFRIRSIRRQQTVWAFFIAKVIFALGVSYAIAFISLSVLNGINAIFNSANFESSGTGRKPFVTILFWTRWFDEKAPIGDFDIKRCLPEYAHVSTDRTNLMDADALIFHSRDFLPYDLPKYRRPNQIWIFLTLESPFFSGIEIPLWHNISQSGIFNWTATYRRDSDVYCPYGAIRRVSPEIALAKTEPYFERGIKNKTNRVLWFAGNCHTMSNREHFVATLKKHYPVDIFGPCGDEQDKKSPFYERFNECNTRKKEMDCWRTLVQYYKYYLSLENSFCRDYITEKFYRPMLYGILPIVGGGHGQEDYQ